MSSTSRLGSIELGCFRLDEVIGHGSYGVTYRASQLGFDRDVVVKVAHADLLESRDRELIRRRFRDELRAATRVEHPNLVTLYTAGETTDGLPAIAMELVSGDVLEDLLVAHPTGLPPALLAQTFVQLASALVALHEAGVVHRDLSPRNIMLDIAGSKPRLKVLDFGVARLPENPRHTVGAVGTPRYMAPEQLNGRSSTASDMFSLGAILWWALTGEEYRRDTLSIEDLYLSNLEGRSDSDPRTIMPDLPAGVSSLTERLLSRRASERPTAEEFLSQWPEAVAELQGRSGSPRSSSRARPIVPPPPPLRGERWGGTIAEPSVSTPPSFNSMQTIEADDSSLLGPRVLVIDPNAVTQRLVVGCLRRNGCRVSATQDPAEATRPATSAFDLVVLSLNIAAVDPVELARYLRDHHPDQWVVFSGPGTLDEPATEAGVRDLFGVPADFGRIESLVDLLRGELAFRDSSRPNDEHDAIDRSTLDALFADDPIVLRETIEVFLGQVPESLVRIGEYHLAGDQGGIREECRSLGTSAQALGANHLARLAEAVATLVGEGDLQTVPGFVEELEREYALVFRTLMDVHTSTLPGGLQ